MNLFKTTQLFLWLILASLLLQNKTLAQSVCATELFPNQTTYQNNTRAARAEIDISTLGDMIDVPLVAHILTDENLSTGLSKPDLLAAIDDLNEAFEPASFYFNLCHVNYITNKGLGAIKYSRQGFSNEFTMAARTAQSNALNIYFVPDARGLNNQTVCGWSSYPADLEAFNKNWIVINNACVNNGSTLAHEVGHYFNLYHTHQGTSTSLQIEETELVGESNCGPNVGDELCDTPAEPYREGFGLIGTVNEGCTFACDYFDDVGNAYDPDNGMGLNYMSYAPASCRVYFSPDQITRMKISYLFDRGYLSDICPKATQYSTAKKDSLYLLALYHATGGPNWHPIQWNLDSTVTKWQGVQLNQQGLVTIIELQNNNLNGSIPIEIGNFQALETLNLSDNQISGTLPLSLGNLRTLKTLNLKNNALNDKIPSELGYLYLLEELDLSNNQLSGSIPAKLSNLDKLSYFSLSNNALSGCFHNNLSNLCDINSINISNDWPNFCAYQTNQCTCNRRSDSLALINLYTATKGHSWLNKWNLTHSINQWHGIALNDLGCVQKIDLTNNQLVGELPQEIQDLQYLDTLILSNNTVCGNIPSVIGQLHQLKVLDLSNNIISGSIPTEINDLQKLEVLRLNANQMCGYIPHEIGDLNKLKELYIADNMFTKCYHAKIIDLVDESDDAANDFYQLAMNNPCTNCNMDDWTALKTLYSSVNADTSFDDKGLLDNTLTAPPVNCNLKDIEGVWVNKYGRVKHVHWNNAGLTGSIPENINLLEDLGGLYLDGNNLEGSLPATMGELDNLYSLYLSNNPDMDLCFPSEMLCLCDQTYVFFGNDNHFLQNSTQNFELFCSNVANNCDGNDADIVYPGDFNADGVVNHYDLLNWSLALGNEGPARTNPTNEWLPQTCEDWIGEANGINYKHKDANGDGYINEEDLAVMSLNYNRSIFSEDFIPEAPSTNESGYQLTLLPTIGSENTFDIYLDSDDQTINSANLQGLAFTLEFGELPIENIHFDFLNANKQPTAESTEEVDGAYEIAFIWSEDIQVPINQPKTEEDPFGRAAISIVMDDPMDDTISLKINQGVLLNGSDDFLSSAITTLDHYFDNSDAIAGISCANQAISAYFGTDQQLYADSFIISPRNKFEFTTIDPCSKVEFKSGSFVELKPGFFAEYGSMFLAVNRECIGGGGNRNSHVDRLINHLNIYPNPIQSEGTLEFTLQNQSMVSIALTDITGKQIQQIANNANKTKGTHQHTFNVDELPTGVYYCTLKVNDFVNTKKIIVVK